MARSSPETKIGHVHFHVRDLKQAKEFYHSVLGFDITGDYQHMSALLSLPEATIIISA